MTESVAPTLSKAQKLGWLLLMPAAALLIEYVRFYSQHPADDAYIFMRIARVWVDTGAPYFNPGDRVMGHSSHLWLWLLTLLFRLFGPLPVLVRLCSAAALVACLSLASMLLRLRLRSPAGGVLLAATVLALLLATDAADLMETPLALAMLLGAFLALERGHDGWFGFLAGLCLLTRYEFAAVVAFGFLLARNRRAFLMGLAPPLLAFLGFTLHYFGTLIPQTALAKSRVYFGGRAELLKVFRWPWDEFEFFRPETLGLLVIVVALAALTAARRIDKPGAEGRWPLLALGVGGVQLSAHLWQDGLMFPWYWPLITVPVALAICAESGGRWRWLLPLGFAMGLGGLVRTNILSTIGLLQRDPGLRPAFISNLRVDQYLSIAGKIKGLRPDATLMTSEIGGLGWALYPNTIYDGAGLVTPAALRYHPMPVPTERISGLQGAIPVGLVQELHPDYIVSMEIFSMAVRHALTAGQLPEYKSVARLSNIPPEYREKYRLPPEFWSSRHTDVFERQPAP